MAKKTIPINLLAIKTSLKKIVDPVLKHSTIIVVVVTAGILIYSIIIVNIIITPHDDNTYRCLLESHGFDEVTLYPSLIGQFDENSNDLIAIVGQSQI